MRLTDHWRDVGLSLSRHKLRTSLTAMGVFWGICLVVLSMGLGKGLERGLFEIFRDNSFNSIWFSGGKASIPHQGLPPGRTIKLTIEDVQAVDRAVKGIVDLTPRKQLQGDRPVSFGNKSRGFPIMGIYPGYHVIERTILMEGRLINWRDVQEARRVAVIGTRVVDLLFGAGQSPIGKRINLQGINYLVVGTFTDVGEEEIRRIYVPYPAAQRSFGRDRYVDLIVFNVGANQDGGTLETLAQSVLTSRHRVAVSDRGAISIYNNLLEYMKFQALFTGIALFTAMVAIGTLFAGLVGVGNIMLIAVRERTREIGLRKALGATPMSIVTMVVFEAFLITAIAGCAGIVTGIGAVELLRHSEIKAGYFRDPEVDPMMALGALLILLIGGVIAGLIPAWQASRIHPVEALRAE